MYNLSSYLTKSLDDHNFVKTTTEIDLLNISCNKYGPSWPKRMGKLKRLIDFRSNWTETKWDTSFKS